MTREEQLRRQVEVLRDGIREAMGRHFESDGVQADRAWDDLDDALAAADRIAAEPVEETVPAPTWRPIAELPPEWRDGRRLLLRVVDNGLATYRVRRGHDVDNCQPDATLYLDLAIPEVPRG